MKTNDIYEANSWTGIEYFINFEDWFTDLGVAKQQTVAHVQQGKHPNSSYLTPFHYSVHRSNFVITIANVLHEPSPRWG